MCFKAFSLHVLLNVFFFDCNFTNNFLRSIAYTEVSTIKNEIGAIVQNLIKFQRNMYIFAKKNGWNRFRQVPNSTKHF